MQGHYATLKPRIELLEVLYNLAAFQGRAVKKIWCIVRQSVLIREYLRYMKRYGRDQLTMSRRTLNYQLAGLVRDRFLRRQPRPTRNPKTGKPIFRPTLYELTTRGNLWVKKRLGWVKNPSGRLRVQKVALSSFKSVVSSSTAFNSAVDKAPTAPQEKGHEKTVSARRIVRSTISQALPRPSKALIRRGPGTVQGRARKPAAQRNGR